MDTDMKKEILGWRYELASYRIWENDKPVGYDGWHPHISFDKPNASEGMRNIIPLVAAEEEDAT